jgi:glutamate-1-semialdehyde 2,1-aminomutase
LSQIARDRLHALREREMRLFTELRPRSMCFLERARPNMPNGVPMAWMATLYEHPPIVVDRGGGAAFTDIDGNSYIDFNLADTSMFTGHGAEAVARAAAERLAAGSQFLLPTEDSEEVVTALAERFGLPSWQFTLSATQANTEAIRVARAVTGRSTVLMFDGKYHGQADELLGEVEGAASCPKGWACRSTPRDTCAWCSTTTSRRSSVSWPAGTWPACWRSGHHQHRRSHAGGRVSQRAAPTGLEKRRAAGARRTHTLVAGPGGLTARWDLEPDMLVMGKSISSGIPLGAYGMTATVARVLQSRPSASFADVVATGGTLFANALSMAAARVTLAEVLTARSYEHAAALGGRLADGIEAAAAAHGLRWRPHRLYNRSGYTHAPELPANAVDARATFDAELYNMQRLYMANRGVWEAIDSAGPACGIQTSEADVDRYLETLDGFLDEVTPPR